MSATPAPPPPPGHVGAPSATGSPESFDDIERAAQYYYNDPNGTAESWTSIQGEVGQLVRLYPQGVADQKRFGRTTASIQGIQYFIYAVAGCRVQTRLRHSTLEVQSAIFFSELVKLARSLVERDGPFAPGEKYSGLKALHNENTPGGVYPGGTAVPWFRYLFVTSSQAEPKDAKSLFTRQFKEYCKGTLQNKYLPAWNQLNPGGLAATANRRTQLDKTHLEVWKTTQPEHWKKYQESADFQAILASGSSAVPDTAYIKSTAWLAFEWLGPAGDPETQEPTFAAANAKAFTAVTPTQQPGPAGVAIGAGTPVQRVRLNKDGTARKQRGRPSDSAGPGNKKRRMTPSDGMTTPAPEGMAVAQPYDPRVETLKKYQVWQIAYCRDICKVVHHSIAARDSADNQTMVGRAHTVSGPDIYLNALEKIKPGQVYVHGDCNDKDAVWSPGWVDAYLKPRGAVGVVVSGGVYKSWQCCTSAVPIFAGFVSPSPAINRKASESVGKPTTVGGVEIRSGDLVMGDKDGVIVIPQENEDDLFEHLDAYINANAMFGKVAAMAIKKGTAMTKEPALAAMFNKKYKRPESYWRDYAGWWAEWQSKYPGIEDSAGTESFYSGTAAAATMAGFGGMNTGMMPATPEGMGMPLAAATAVESAVAVAAAAAASVVEPSSPTASSSVPHTAVPPSVVKAEQVLSPRRSERTT